MTARIVATATRTAGSVVARVALECSLGGAQLRVGSAAPTLAPGARPAEEQACPFDMVIAGQPVPHR